MNVAPLQSESVTINFSAKRTTRRIRTGFTLAPSLKINEPKCTSLKLELTWAITFLQVRTNDYKREWHVFKRSQITLQSNFLWGGKVAELNELLSDSARGTGSILNLATKCMDFARAPCFHLGFPRVPSLHPTSKCRAGF